MALRRPGREGRGRAAGSLPPRAWLPPGWGFRTGRGLPGIAAARAGAGRSLSLTLPLISAGEGGGPGWGWGRGPRSLWGQVARTPRPLWDCSDGRRGAPPPGLCVLIPSEGWGETRTPASRQDPTPPPRDLGMSQRSPGRGESSDLGVTLLLLLSAALGVTAGRLAGLLAPPPERPSYPLSGHSAKCVTGGPPLSTAHYRGPGSPGPAPVCTPSTPRPPAPIISQPHWHICHGL